MRNLCDAAYMSCEVAALPFQANVNYRTWCIDFVLNDNYSKISNNILYTNYKK